MASYRGHLATSTVLGVIYGGLSWHQFNVDWPIATVGGILTAVGGLLPDLDSDSGVPVREMSHLAAALAPILLLRRMAGWGLSHEQTFLAAAGIYSFIRFMLFRAFRRITVHRGMYHSIPAMLIAGLIIFLACEHPHKEVRAFMAVGTMLGFLSHLVLDELCSVGFNGVAPKLNQFAGTAVKFYSPSMSANVLTYALLLGLGYVAYGDVEKTPASRGTEPPLVQNAPVMKFRERKENDGQLRWRPGSSPRNRPAGGVPLSMPGPRE